MAIQDLVHKRKAQAHALQRDNSAMFATQAIADGFEDRKRRRLLELLCPIGGMGMVCGGRNSRTPLLCGMAGHCRILVLLSPAYAGKNFQWSISFKLLQSWVFYHPATR